ncbi:hypothetical protein A2673_04080 [Candidatus Kaiserbacteria bacterium RIFCSPHIGHO2_01_FULL_50_13]|uniref:Uncharacterized protein n=1 Tax=Candidatus Kaiserbacteria bacterium RIFCSPLOWO2_01_FULL_50_24 TaxID=1798507 RepID=A0A1F6END5_9BACT|nr:MAG: hypothetical protein A2673_04080 [Candidatus Kaiserbacteria bacterium RIFCSPHIGHO2_01_FULL_50_13]OGG75149.1 MAG: hypothetical protein A3A34_02225 [Candidatus Kaiserbacteria bacterium RIFCSPLOWO2_01_FULL_50_24]OGG81072.1 MAG: hypothetical protein A3H74_04085 [Candidatus Kaiserbacteria bacterium RIFCSPLOWO2_02_FULL_51_13]
MQNLHDTLYTVARWAMITLVALLPIFVILVDWVVVAQSKGFLIGTTLILAAVFWVAGSVAEGVVRVPKSALLIVAALLPASYIVSAVFTGASWESYIGNATSVDTVAAAVTFYVLFAVITSLWANRNTKALLFTLFISGSVLALFSTTRLLVSHEWTNLGGVLTGVATSAIGSWHDLGIFLALFIFLALTMAHAVTEKRYIRLALYVLAGVAGFMLIVNNFRDLWYGTAALFSAYGLLYAYSLRSNAVPWRAIILGKAGACIAIAVALLLFGYGGTWAQERFPQSLQVVHMEVRPSWRGTIAVGERALTGRELFFGTGPNTFVRDWSLHKPQGVNATEFWSVDFTSGVGTVPTSVVTVGLFGALAWGLIICSLFFLMFRRETWKDHAGCALTMAALFLTAYQVLYTPGITLLALTFIMYALLVAYRARNTGAFWSVPIGITTVREGVALVIVCALVLFSIGMSVQSLRRLASDAFVNRSILEYRTTGDIDMVVRDVALANSMYPNSDRVNRAAVELGLLKLRALAVEGVQTEEAGRMLQGTLSRTIAHALTATVAEEGNYQNWLTLAQLYGVLAGSQIEGAEEHARQAYDRVRETNPTSPMPLLGLAQMELMLGNTDAARELLVGALQLKPNLPIAHFLLSQIDAGAGDLVRAREAAVATAELVPEDPLAWYNLGTILYASQDYPAALLALERAVALQANYANALFVLALSHYELGNEEQALAILEILQGLEPTHELLQRVIENMQNGLAPFDE